MSKKKDVMIFGNLEQIKQTNMIIGAGIGMIVVGVIVTMFGEGRFYNITRGIGCEDPSSNAINDIFESVTGKRKGA